MFIIALIFLVPFLAHLFYHHNASNDDAYTLIKKNCIGIVTITI